MVLVFVEQIYHDNMIGKIRKILNSIFANVRRLGIVERSDVMRNVDQPKVRVDFEQPRFYGPWKVIVVTDIRGQG